MNWAAVLLHPRHAFGSPSTTLLLFIGYKYMQGVGIENRTYSIDFRNNLIVSILFKITIRHIWYLDSIQLYLFLLIEHHSCLKRSLKMFWLYHVKFRIRASHTYSWPIIKMNIAEWRSSFSIHKLLMLIEKESVIVARRIMYRHILII